MSSSFDVMTRQFDFLCEIDRLKSVVRQSPLLDRSRRENSAEHSWHLAMYALLLQEYAATPAGFALAGVETLRHEVRVEGAGAIADLLCMTPHLYRASPEGRARAAALTGITLTVDVRLASYRRNA